VSENESTPAPPVSAENLRFILGLKLKSLRGERGLTLQALAGKSGLAVSYLSEIEKGKKYPKPDKLLDLARALGVPFDELISMQVSDALGAAKAVFSSEFFREFPFEMFGIAPQDLFGLIKAHPEQAGALVRTLLEVGRTYDLHVEQFLLAALRSYQEQHANYFEELELSAAQFRTGQKWGVETVPDAAMLRAVLEKRWGYVIDEKTLAGHSDLSGLRSVYLEGDPPRLLLNGRLLPTQKAFILGREIGYRELGLKARALTSVWLKVESFDQVLNNFKASYFSGALLLNRDRLVRDVKALFAKPRWQGEEWLALMQRYRATPEMFFHRLTELIPRFFGLREVYFMRLGHTAGSSRYDLTKVFNLARVPVPHGVNLNETYCRRWLAIRMAEKLIAAKRPPAGGAPILAAERIHFIDQDTEFFVLTTARFRALNPGATSSVSLGIRLDEGFRKTVKFWDDPRLARRDVNLTCERCLLADCAERAAPPTLHRQLEANARRERAVEALIRQARAE
jgi:transcriptional regulator with XRE-family HTH domain